MPSGSSDGGVGDPAGVGEVEVGEEGEEASRDGEEDDMDDCCSLKV